MKYKISITKKFWKSAKRLKKKYTNEEFKEIVAEIQESILILGNEGYLPKEYKDHLLRRSPFQDYNEYHV